MFKTLSLAGLLSLAFSATALAQSDVMQDANPSKSIFTHGYAPTAAEWLKFSHSKQDFISYQLRPEYFGAVGNGIADDTAAVQNWINALIAVGGEGTCNGTYRLMSGVNGFTALNSYHIRGAVMENCKFYIDFNGWGTTALDFTNPVSPSSSNRGAPIEIDHVHFVYNDALTAPPLALRARYATNLYFHDLLFQQYTLTRGTVLQISGVWNSHLREVQIWGGGGFRANHLINSATTFSITAASQTLTASQSEFVPSDVGSSISIFGTSNGNAEQFLIDSYTSGTSVHVTRPASFTHTAQTAAFSGITGSITAASQTLTISNPRLTTADIGRVVYVAGAGAPYNGTPPLRAKITGVSGTTITLDTAATTTVSNVELIIDPAFDIFADTDGGFSGTNDFSSLNLHMEENSGVSLLAQACGSCTFQRSKIEIDITSPPWGTNDFNGQSQAAFFGGGGVFDGMDNGSAVSSVGQIWVQDQGMTFSLGDITGTVSTGQPAVSMQNNSVNALISIGDRSIGNLVASSWLPYLYFSDGTSTFGATTIGNISAYNSGNVPTIFKGSGISIGNPLYTATPVNIMAQSGVSGALSLQSPVGGQSCLREFQSGSTTANGALCFDGLGFNVSWPFRPASAGVALGTPGSPWGTIYGDNLVSNGAIHATTYIAGGGGAYATVNAWSSVPTGAQAYVTDAASCASRLSAVTGGGSTFCPVVYNGSAWLQD